jgi:hypothetical protein
MTSPWGKRNDFQKSSTLPGPLRFLRKHCSGSHPEDGAKGSDQIWAIPFSDHGRGSPAFWLVHVIIRTVDKKGAINPSSLSKIQSKIAERKLR